MNELNLRDLAAYFPASDIEWRPGATTKKKDKALALAYITNRAIMQRLDEVCGPERWQNAFKPGPTGQGLLCGIGINVGPLTDPNWVWKWDGAENTDVEAVKGGLSGSMKRAAVQWGIGRYLYEFPQIWAPLNDYKQFAQRPKVPREFLPSQRRSESPRTLKPAEDPTLGQQSAAVYDTSQLAGGQASASAEPQPFTWQRLNKRFVGMGFGNNQEGRLLKCAFASACIGGYYGDTKETIENIAQLKNADAERVNAVLNVLERRSKSGGFSLKSFLTFVRDFKVDLSDNEAYKQAIKDFSEMEASTAA